MSEDYGDELVDGVLSGEESGSTEAEPEPADMLEGHESEHNLAHTEIEEFAAGGEETATHPSIQGNVGASH
ncbi:MAG TPA: hypothetical protein VFE42_20910 [Chloroflexota bacterium]|nr:hypothetical protein [Chloroflexota bacterium]